MIVNSKGEQYRVRLPAEWKPAGYTCTVAPPGAPDESDYVVYSNTDSDMLVAVPDSDIEWDGDTPVYTGTGELSFW